MAGPHAFIDESTSTNYVVVCSVVPLGHIERARKALRGLLLPKQRSIHMKDERPARQKQILDTISALETTTTLYTIDPRGLRGGQVEARDRCLQQAAADAAAMGVSRLTLDRIDSFVKRDRASILRSTGPRPEFAYYHQNRHEELLLSLPDAIAWAYARGGEMRARVQPGIVVKRL